MDALENSADRRVAAGDLGADLVRVLQEAARPRRLMRGETLIEEGSDADALYFVLSGRFTVLSGSEPIAEIGSGEPVGEIAFFGGGIRSASVVAARASDVLELSREAYDAALAREPGLSTAVITALARRLRQTVSATKRLRPRPAQTIGLVPGGSGPLDHAAMEPLVAAFRTSGATVISKREDLDAGVSIADLALRGDIGQRIIVVCRDPEEDREWADDLYQQCDTIVVCLDRRRGDSTPMSPLERRISANVLCHNSHLVVVRDAGEPISGTGRLLEGRSFGLHHHMEAGSSKDAVRIARLVEGNGLGVVFGGGGAFGTAHLAILKALGEFGVEIDMVGGTSVGAAMAGAFAMGLSMDEVIDRFEEMFVTSRAASRYTLPVWSIVDHTHFDAQLRHHYGASFMAEDLPINFYALSTSLTRNAPVVLRRGALWRLIRASSAIPAVFPPMVMDDGEVLVDGGLFDNVPVEAMRKLKAGPNLVLSLHSTKDWRVRTDYDQLPGRAGALRRVMGARRGELRFPGIASVMNRSLIVNSEMLKANIDREGDIFIDLPRMQGMGFMQWSKGRDLFDKTYAQTTERLNVLAAEHSGVDLLHALADGR